MKKILLFSMVTFSFFSCSDNTTNLIDSNKIIFTWDINPFDDTIGSVTETIDDLTVTVTAPLSEHTHSMGYFDIIDSNNISDGNVVVSFRPETTITFVFNKPVTVQSILALSGDNKEIEYTFAHLEGNKSVVTQTLNPGIDVAFASVNLNWTNIMSFTVTSATPTLFGFDFLTVVDATKQ